MSQLLVEKDLQRELTFRNKRPLSTTSNVNYEEIDTIRFILICFIVWGHCLLGWNNRTFSSSLEEIIQITVIQIGKIGTVVFFIISGFLLNNRLERYTIKSYLKEKFPQIYGPWLFFICILSAISVLQLAPISQILSEKDLGKFLYINYQIVDGVVLYTAYWFIISYLVGMLFIIGLKKYVGSIWFIAGLLLFTIFYSVNLYFEWMESNHSKAILSYTFFIWLGLQMNRHLGVIKAKLNNISWSLILPIVLLIFIVACYEGNYLTQIASADPYSSNRASNIILSVFIFLTLLKFGRVSAINRLNPRKTVYGIYLIHNILIFECMQVIDRYFTNQLQRLNVYSLLVIQICFAAFIVTCTYFIVIAISKSKLKRLIGLR